MIMATESGEWPAIIESHRLEDILADADEIQERLSSCHLAIIKGLGDMSVQAFADFATLFGRLEEPLLNTETHDQDTRVEIMKRTEQDLPYVHTLNGVDRPMDIRKPSSFYWHAD